MSKKHSFIGRKSGSLKAVDAAGRDISGHYFIWCICRCRPEVRVKIRLDNFMSGKSQACPSCRAVGMRGNLRAGKQRRREALPAPVQIADNTSVDIAIAKLNLYIEPSAPTNSLPKCKHGVYLTPKDLLEGGDKAFYCSLCTVPRNDCGAASVTRWDRRLAQSNLDITRGEAPSVHETTSKKARIFKPDADQVWSGGKNYIKAGGVTDLDRTDGYQQIKEAIGGKRKRSAGNDKIQAWQNPTVDYEGTNDNLDGCLVSHLEKGTTEYDRTLDHRKNSLAWNSLDGAFIDAQTVKLEYEIKKEIVNKVKTFYVLENGKQISEHPTYLAALRSVSKLKADIKASYKEETEGSESDRAEDCIDEIDAEIENEEIQDRDDAE